MSFWRSAWPRLLVSHALAGLLGVAVGWAYVTKLSTSTQGIFHSLKRRPLLDAASTAFRFGSPKHARATTESFLRIPTSNVLEWGDTMFAELRLAILDGELAQGSKGSPHLDRARAACQRFRGSDCALEQLRALATKLAHQRR